MSPKTKSVLVNLAFSLTGLFIGFGIYYFFVDDSPPKPFLVETRSKQNYQFINPLLECDNGAISNNGNLNKLRDQINDFINEENQAGHISLASVYFRDLNNGPWFGIKEKELFSPASLVKVPLMMAYLKASETDPGLLSRELVNTKAFDPKAQNIQPDQVLELNKSYTVDELIRRMIVYSDNLAYELLAQSIDNQKIIQVYNDLGVDISHAYTDPNGNILSVKDYASFFRILFNSSYLTKNDSEKALRLLSQSTFKNGLVKPLPQNILVSHKFGERHYDSTDERQLHDCGIVYRPQRPYLLCVMTRGSDFNILSSVISRISDMVYQEINH